MFVYETSNYYKLKVFFVSLFVIVLILGFSISLFFSFREVLQGSSFFLESKEFFYRDIKDLTPIGMFYIGFFTALFFIPLPTELFFILSLNKGNSFVLTVSFLLAGFFVSQALNYYLGAKFSNFFLNLISKKKVYSIKRKVNKYGIYSIFAFNILPLPAPVLSFALGIAKYNVPKFAISLFVSNIIKFVILFLLYSFFHNSLFLYS